MWLGVCLTDVLIFIDGKINVRVHWLLLLGGELDRCGLDGSFSLIESALRSLRRALGVRLLYMHFLQILFLSLVVLPSGCGFSIVYWSQDLDGLNF
jgi:hypothetical protein